MVEIAFNDSACGGLKMAQHFGEGEFKSATEVFVSCADDREPTKEEIQTAHQEAVKREKLEWEKGTPIGGNPADIYGFHYVQSVGDISEPIPDKKRSRVLEWLYSIHPYIEQSPSFSAELMQTGKTAIKEVCNRISSGERVRIWYSNNPDELCGMYWFMTQLNELELQKDQIILVQLPDWEIGEDGEIITQSGWGGISPGRWHRYLDSQRVVGATFCSECATHWGHLKQENAPLRAVLNGRLVSMPETIYDKFIIQEIDAESDEFDEAMIIGRVLGKYMLGIGDAWIAHRIEKMICDGKLVPVTEPAKGSPIYHRKLRKCFKI